LKFFPVILSPIDARPMWPEAASEEQARVRAGLRRGGEFQTAAKVGWDGMGFVGGV
jgi:hypothetical protein